MCISSCGSQRAYDAGLLACVEVDSGTSDSSAATALVDLQFVPLPYAIGGVLVAVVVVALHLTKGVSVMSVMIGVNSLLLFMSALTAFIVMIITGSTTTGRLLVGSISSMPLEGYLLLGCMGVYVATNLVAVVMYRCMVRTNRYTVAWVALICFKLIASALCSNIYGVNMKVTTNPYATMSATKMSMAATKMSKKKEKNEVIKNRILDENDISMASL